MLRIFVIAAAGLLAFGSDSLVEEHCRKVEECIERGECDRSCSAYERPEPLHGLHRAEEWIFAGLFITALAAFIPNVSKIGLAQPIWAIGLVFLILIGGTAAAFELVADGAEGQFGAKLSFWDSAKPLFLADLLVLAMVGSLLYWGPPRGWSGQDEFGWL